MFLYAKIKLPLHFVRKKCFSRKSNVSSSISMVTLLFVNFRQISLDILANLFHPNRTKPIQTNEVVFGRVCERHTFILETFVQRWNLYANDFTHVLKFIHYLFESKAMRIYYGQLMFVTFIWCLFDVYFMYTLWIVMGPVVVAMRSIEICHLFAKVSIHSVVWCISLWLTNGK